MTEYKCFICNHKTTYFKDIKNHLNRKYNCFKKNTNKEKVIYSDDQLLLFSLFPYINNVHIIEKTELDYLENSDIIYTNKDNLFKTLETIEKTHIKHCIYCNESFDKIQSLKNHILNDCYYKYLSNNNEKKQNLTINNINITDSFNTNINSPNILINNFFDMNAPIPFDKDWDFSKISHEKQSELICSIYMYSQLLDEILKNENNLNVILNKNKNTGLVYMNDSEKYIQMETHEIIRETMFKLNKLLNEMNKSNELYFKEIITFSRQMINKKHCDYNNNLEINNNVNNMMTNMYYKKRNVAKNKGKCVFKNDIELDGY